MMHSARQHPVPYWEEAQWTEHPDPRLRFKCPICNAEPGHERVCHCGYFDFTDAEEHDDND